MQWRARRCRRFPIRASGRVRDMSSSTDESMRVYHNPVCSKSRGALEILGERGVDIEVIEYLKANPSRADLKRILDAIPDPPAALVRKDKRFGELGLDAGDYHAAHQGAALRRRHHPLIA